MAGVPCGLAAGEKVTCNKVDCPKIPGTLCYFGRGDNI